MIETLVIATDGSASVKRAVTVAMDLAERFGASVHVIYVIDADEIEAAPESIREELREGLENRAPDVFDELSQVSGSITTSVRTGRPAVEIVSYAEEVDADIVAIGTRGRHGEHRLLLGSVAEAVVRRSPIPVLTVRQLSDPGVLETST